MEPPDPYSHQQRGGHSAEQGTQFNISPVPGAQIEPQDAHWLRMDPSLTRAVLAKTEEELLGSLAALMRNKVECEQASRRFAQIQLETEQAKQELATIKEQIRCAEEEVATRLHEQSRINEEIVRVREELTILRQEHDEPATAGTAEQSQTEKDLPLLFGAEAHTIAAEWDSYLLESEFHTDEELDAGKVAELVSQLPGLEGCLIVKNHGPVLASRMPERFHGHLKVPDRNYALLFERLEKKVADLSLQNAHLATFDLGQEALTVTQANQAFVLVNHGQTKLRPGMPEKLASIAFEVAQMYP
jgi:hypothetical protein